MVLPRHKQIDQRRSCTYEKLHKTTGAATDKQQQQQDEQGCQPHGRGSAAADNSRQQHGIR